MTPEKPPAREDAGALCTYCRDVIWRAYDAHLQWPGNRLVCRLCREGGRVPLVRDRRVYPAMCVGHEP